MLSNSRAVRVVANEHPRETPLDAGPAQCPQLEAELEERFAARYGSSEDLANEVALNAFEAEWLATESAVYYVWPSAGLLFRLAWPDVTKVSVSGASRVAPVRGGKVRTVTFVTRSGRAIQVVTGSMAAKALHKIAKRRR